MSIADDAATFGQTDIAADAASFQPQPSVAPPVVPEGQDWTTAGGPVLERKKEPGFLQKVGLIESATAQGMLDFTAGLGSIIEKGLRFGGKPTVVPDAYDYWAQRQKDLRNEYDFSASPITETLAGTGKLGAQILTTAPSGGLFRGVANKALSLGAGEAISSGAAALAGKIPGVGAALAKPLAAALPKILQTPAKYALSGAGSVGVLAGMEGFRFDPENPTGFNTESAKNMAESTVSSPLGFALGVGLPMAGTAFSSWANKAQKLGEISEIVPGAIPRNVLPEGAKRTLYQSIFGIIPALTQAGTQINEIRNIGKPIWNFITDFADMPQATNAADIMKVAGKTLQNTLKNIKQNVANAWNQPFKAKAIEDTAEVVIEANKALGIIKGVSSAIPSAGLYTGLIEKQLAKVATPKAVKSPLLDIYGKPIPPSSPAITKNLTLEDVKNIQSNIGSAISKVKKEGGTNEIIQALSDIRENLYTHMQKSLSPSELTAFTNAKTQSKLFYEFKSNSPLVEEAMVKEVQSRNLIRKLIGANEPLDKQMIFDQMGVQEKQGVAAVKLAEEWRKSDKANGFDINGFVTRVRSNPELAPLMGNEAFKKLEGLNNYLVAVKQGAKTGWWREMAIATMVGVPAYLSGVGPVATVGAMVSLGAATYVANHPRLKNLFYGLTKNLPPSTKAHITKTIGGHLGRAGYLLGTDGVLKQETTHPSLKGQK